MKKALIVVTNHSPQIRQHSLVEAVDANRRVLESQRSLYAAEDQLVQSERAVAVSLIALYKALGGGWEVWLPTGRN